MTEESSVSAVIAAAEQAAVAGDYEGAERHLRTAVSLQEATLGRVHPDLANTLNNLGVACEQAGKLDEAEAAYRRAYSIAQEAFPPGHPFVIRSAENLRDFCEARGRPFDVLPQVPPVQAEAVPAGLGPVSLGPMPGPGHQRSLPSAASISEFEPARAPGPVASHQLPTPAPVHPRSAMPTIDRTPHGPGRRSSALLLSTLAIVGAAALIVVWLFVGRDAPAENDGTGPVTVTPAATSPSDPGGTATDSTAAESAVSPTVGPIGPASGPTSTPSEPSIATGRPKPTGGPTITVVRAEVCRNFLPRAGGAEWRCERVIGTTTPGPLAFYTRLRSPRTATVEHWWYRGDRLDHRAQLRISANPGAGYRTFSRNSIAAAEAGDWRVELRTSDGALLHEARFSVR